MGLWEKIKSSVRMAKYQSTLQNLHANNHAKKTVDDILNELDKKDYRTFANLLDFHAKENISYNAFYASLASYVRSHI